MKKHKILFWVGIAFILLIIIQNIILKSSIATNGNKITVSGCVKDINGNPKENIDVIFLDKSNNTVATLKTDSKGYYTTQVEAGDYVIQFNYGEEYNTKNISVKKYGLYNKNLELAFVYKTGTKIELIQNKFTDDSHTLRIIENEYTNDSEIESKISILQKDSNNEHAFHKPGIDGWKTMGIILTDQEENIVKKYISKNFNDIDYKFLIINSKNTVTDIVSKIYNDLLELSPEDVPDVIDNSNINTISSKTKILSLDSTSIIDVTLEKTNSVTGDIPLDSSYSDFITGNLKIVNKHIDSNVVVTLENTATGQKSSVNTGNSGKYSFPYPGGGTYKINYEFDPSNGINGQYYEPDDKTYKKIGTTTDANQNCLKTDNTNLQEIKDKFKTINYESENKIDNDPGESKLIGFTDVFYVPSISEEYNPNDNKIYGGVNLKEREQFKLNVEQYNINRYKIVLSNGQVFKQYDQYKDHSTSKDLRFFNITLDPKLGYGAELFIEYEIKIRNNSNIDCDGFTFISRFENLRYDENQYLLSNTNKNNNTQGWSVITNEDVKTLTGIDDTTDSSVILKIEKNETIASGEEKSYYVTLTMPLDADECRFDSSTELVQYKNNEGRRNYENNNKIIKAGNFLNEPTEKDSGESEYMIIIPPTGLNIK